MRRVPGHVACCLPVCMIAPSAPAWALAVLLGTASVATAAPLLAPARDARSALALAGVAQVQRLVLDRTALADLRARDAASVAGFPLGGARRATLELERFDPFGPDARLVLVGDGGPQALAPPDRVWFVGRVRGEPGSRALVVAGPDHVHGFVVSGGDVFPFGPDAAGHHRSYALSAADPAAMQAPNDFCLQDVHGPALDAFRQTLAAQVPQPPPTARAVSGALLGVDLAIETDQELRAKFGSNAETLDYLGSLVAAANVIYERDTRLRLRASFVRLWATTDPWTKSSTLDALYEVQAHWTDPDNHMATIAGPRDAVQFVSGKSIQGGVAWVAAVCSPDVGFAVSQVAGHFDTASPQQIWDVLVFTHELGHTLGSPHTHCYDPPIDRCYSGEAGCYSGPAQPTSNGTIMSYCHLQAGGLANVSLLFGTRPSDVIRATAESASCLTPVEEGGATCGNGVLEAGEACDDGNTAAGDGCDGTCRREPACGDGRIDAGETCDDGNSTAGDGCSATCAREPRCGDGVVDPGETCDDRNSTAGDGCSASCALEPCAVLLPHQTAWAPARLSWSRSARSDTLRLKVRFGVPASAGLPAVDLAGLRVLATAADGSEQLALEVPAGAGWLGGSRERRWRRRAGGGGVSAQVRDLGGGEVRTVDLRLVASGRWALGAEDLPLAVTVVFGGEPAGRAGLCGRHGYGAGSCTVRGGRRITCR